MSTALVTLDSITDADIQCKGKVVLSGSHGGMLPAAIASQYKMRAVVLNDAGQGLNNAGVAGILALDAIGMAAASVAHSSCHIGSSHSMLERGVISVANQTALALGIEPGQTTAMALELLQQAPQPAEHLPPVTEARQHVDLAGRQILLCDSASLVKGSDTDAIIVAGSHGALIGNDPARALKAKARFAAFNDAGGGLDNIGIGRLAALEQRGVAAVTYSHNSAEIGNAASALATGQISAFNQLAGNMGAVTGMSLKQFLSRKLS